MNNINTPSRDRWQHTSCLQKAIRRNLPDLAVPSARFLWGWNPRYLMRRMAVIAFEDVGLANIDLLERYLTTAHPILKEGQFSGGDREKVVGFVRAFCASPKSRYLTRIGATVHYHPGYKTITAESHNAILTDKTANALQETDVLKVQALALTCPPKELADALHREGKGLLANLMLLGGRLGCEGLPRILFATRNEQPVETRPTDLPPVEMLGHFPAWVFDRHTRLGARALRLFVQRVPELKGLSPETAAWVAYRILFRLESGLLDRETFFTSDNAVEEVWWTTLMVEGLTLPDVFAIRESLREKIPVLNDIRRGLLGITSDNQHSRNPFDE